MELKTTEEEMEIMVTEYKRLLKAETRLADLNTTNKAENHDAPSTDIINNDEMPMDKAQVLSTLESLQIHLTALQPKMDRFRKRLGEKDPVTDAPRYGEKTATRVTALLETYDALNVATSLAFETEGATPTSVVQDLRNIVERQQEAARQEALRKQEEEQERIQQEKLRAEQQIQEEEKRRQEAEIARAQQEAELSRLAQEARAAREEAEQRALQQEQERRMEQERIDRAWMDSIAKGPEGVQEQLHVVKEATANESGAYSTAVTALHTLFSQIVAHPEDDNFRRVRRDHPKFHQDIGRHDGGREILIAAGFRLGAIDNVPCFISTEPNIETQMDEWSEWFDLLKATLEFLEQELIHCT